ncbi:MAG: aldehyde dehydrogenase [Phycisphaerae bacterium]|nr:aldehyde dehydrogenase [Phycisphaerae bacterium]
MVGTVPVTPADQVPAVVQRARAAQLAWGAMSLTERATALRPAAEALRADTAALATLLTREMGKPLSDATGEVTACAESWGDAIDEIVEALSPETLRDERTHTTMLHEPLGVCAAITPWNFPMLMPQECVLPALMAGNAVILKPSEETPLIAQEWARRVAACLPPDTLQIIFGDRDTGKALVQADVDLIVFTGSRAAGAHILQAAAPALKRVILELGGKDPLVVLRDADLEAAATFAVRNSFRNAGQVCVSTERIYVDRAVAQPFIDLVCRKTAELKQGAGTEPGVQIGPMISARQKETVMKQIAAAKAAGARVVMGDEPAPGNFVRPAVVVDLNHSMDLMREETFGPVACIVPVSDADEAVRLANDTPYGLGAAVFGADVANAERVARRINAGMVGVNRGCGGAKGSPWVGARQSGYGFHSGKAGHRQFAQVRVVSRAVQQPAPA